jgi:hypothetical protein
MALLVLIFYIYAILGYHFFGTLNSARFASFGLAMLTLFRCTTGEDWYKIMFECGKAQGMVLAETYFLSFMILVVFVMLNLFIMVIIQSYEEYDKNPQTVAFIFEQAVYPIKTIWNLFSKDQKGIRVQISDLPEIMKNLNEFGINFNTDHLKIMRFLKALQIETDKEGFIYYNQFLFAILKKKFLKKDSNTYFRKIVGNEEKKTKSIISKLTKKQQKKYWKQKILEDHKETSTNFFLEKILLRSILKGWRNYVRGVVESRKLGYTQFSITPRDPDEDFPGDNTVFEERL